MKRKLHQGHRFLILTGSLFLIVFLNSCHEKGCTNVNAINYNSVADQDDGSCIICKETQVVTDSIITDLVDDYYYNNNPHYGQTVAKIIYTQVSNNYSNKACGSNDCKIYYRIQNLINQEMDFQIRLECTGEIDINTSYLYFQIPAYGSSVQDLLSENDVNNPCGSISNSHFSYYLPNYIVYH